MGKAGRLACIFVPMTLSVASLICLLLVFLGGVNKNLASLRSLYFFKADLTEFNGEVTDLLSGTSLDEELLGSLSNLNLDSQLDDIYTVHLWNYCSGDINDGEEDITFCSDREAAFWFNPIEVWGLESIEGVFPDELKDGLSLYEKVVKWMFAAYTIAFWATVAEIALGIFAICSRWGSCVVTIVSTASTIFTVAASIMSSAIYGTITAQYNSTLQPYNITGEIGSRMLAVTWLAAVFSIGAGLFWMFSSCCCSGRSSNSRSGKSKGITSEKGPFNYLKVGDNPTQENESVPMRNFPSGNDTAYEPYKHASSA